TCSWIKPWKCCSWTWPNGRRPIRTWRPLSERAALGRRPSQHRRRSNSPLSPVPRGEGVGVRGLFATAQPLTPNPSPLSTGERGDQYPPFFLASFLLRKENHLRVSDSRARSLVDSSQEVR